MTAQRHADVRTLNSVVEQVVDSVAPGGERRVSGRS